MQHGYPADNITAKSSKPLPTLRKSLRRIHVIIIVVSLVFSGISLLVMALLALRSYADDNLQLIASTISYSVQRAVVTGDAETAKLLLQDIGRQAEFSQVRILDARHHLFTSWQPPAVQSRHFACDVLSHWLFPQPIQVPVMYGGKEVGQVWLTGDGHRVWHYLTQALKWLSGSMLLSAMLSFYLSKRMHAGIVTGLQNITSVAHEVRKQRAFSLRVPSSSIAELNKLSGDFNSLLDEMSDWQRHLQRENDSLSHQVRHDALTGLPNRTAFEQELNKQLGNPRTAGRVAVMFIDGDRFKEVNDRYGHAAGDLVLATTARRLREILGKEGLVARLGGDEFAVLLSFVDSGDQAGQVAENVIEAMREPITLEEGIQVTQSLSIGVALAKNHISGEAIIAQADAAMYHIKELGGGWYFSPTLWRHHKYGVARQDRT